MSQLILTVHFPFFMREDAFPVGSLYQLRIGREVYPCRVVSVIGDFNSLTLYITPDDQEQSGEIKDKARPGDSFAIDLPADLDFLPTLRIGEH
jgi:hypothetical protein